MRTRALAYGVLLPVLLAAAAGLAADGPDAAAKAQSTAYTYATAGAIDIHAGKNLWHILLDEANLGGREMEMAEISLPGGTTVPSHTHKSLEVIYVLSGTYGHEVNGHYYLLKPGMVGIVRPGDHVRHIVPQGAEARLLIIWTPGGELPVDPSKGTIIPPLSESAG